MEARINARTSSKGRSRGGVVAVAIAMFSATLALAPPARASIASMPDAATWGTNGTVHALARSGNTLYLGGAFTAIVSPDGSQSMPRNGLAAIDASTGEPTSWDPVVGGLSASVYAMAVAEDGGTLFVGGDFTSIDGEPRNRLAAIDVATGAVEPAWQAGFDGRVRALAVSDGVLYVGGSFEHDTSGATRLRLAAVDVDTGDLLSWAPPANNAIRSIVVVPDGRIIVGGFFTEIDGDPAQRYVAALDGSGAPTPWADHPDRPVITMTHGNGSLYSGSGGEPGGHAWAHDLATGRLNWSIPSDGDVQALAVADGRVVAGGHFVGIGTETARHLAALEPATGAVDPSWVPDVNGSLGVAALVVEQDKMHVGGDFATVGGASRRTIASFSVSQTADGPPTLVIDAPSDADAFKTSDRITFAATAHDFEDGDLTSDITWTSDIDGRIGTGGGFSRRLSVGEHTLTVNVRDALGHVTSRALEITVSNTRPKVRITSPTDGDIYTAGDVIAFAGSASDFDDGDVTASLRWTSDLDGSIGTGGTFTTALTAGTHEVTAEARDSAGAATIAKVTVEIQPANSPPSVSIASPEDRTRVSPDTVVSFSGSATDAEDGDLTAAMTWTSSLDGAIGSGAAFSRPLSTGTHTIRARATDAAGTVSKDAITVIVGNAAPAVTITSPTDGAVLPTGTPISLHASATDPEDGDLTSELEWWSSLDGPLGTGGTVVRTFSVGTHTISASVTDQDGASSSATASVTVTPSNTPPTVTIAAPADGSSFRTRDRIRLAATANDAESGDLSARVEWSSNINGPLGSGPVLRNRLSAGRHTITAAVVDDGGLSRTASIAIFVQNTPPHASITSPAGGETYSSGDQITFQATASDFDDGDLSPSISWTSSIDGAIGSGGSFTRRLSVGAHVVRARVADAEGATAKAAVAITVVNSPPTVGIQAPANAASFRTSNVISFEGSAGDVEDGDLAGSISWTSDLDGGIGVGRSFTRRLSQGTHTITAEVTDRGGVTSEASVRVTVNNSPPTIAIQEPANGASFATMDSVALSGTASDFDDGSLTSSISWRSSIDGPLGTGGHVTRSLSQGVHAITASVTDAGGATRTSSISISVGNTPPDVTILTPLNGTTASTAEEIAFQAAANDVDDGNLTATISWTSTIDGPLATGGAFSRRLSQGVHTIAARVSDAGGATTSTTVTIEVTGTPPLISIEAPVDGTNYFTSDGIGLRASAFDTEDGDLGGSIRWSSDRDGFLGAGASLTRHLSGGRHVLTATVTDSASTIRTAVVSIAVENTPPTVSISTPAAGATFATDQPIAFAASASDFDDGDLSGGLRWTSNVVGPLGTGAALSRTLPKGTHVITASISDAAGASASDSVTISVGSAAPTVSIQAPTTGSTSTTADHVAFEGSASDFDDGNLTGSIRWTSSRDGALGTGGSFARPLSKGTHVVTASVTDSDGLTRTATVTITVGNTPPSVSIASPSNGQTFITSDRIAFQGSASDFDDGDLTASITWTSSRDGTLGSGGSFARTLSEGVHTITATVVDADAATRTRQVTIAVGNTPPTLSIASPSNGRAFITSDRIAFQGSASDFDDGSLTGSITWTSSRDGTLGTGGGFSRTLSKGTHVVTASVTDSDGATTTGQVTVTVANTPPTVTISSPANGASFRTADQIPFSGTASDFDQGSLSGALVWTSNVDGQIGTGGSFTRRLTKGTHVVTASATDADGARTTAQVTVAVGNTPTG